MREEIREKEVEIEQLVRCEGSEPVPRRSVKKVMKMAQQSVKLTQKLNTWAWIVDEIINFYHLACMASMMDLGWDKAPLRCL